MTIQDSVHHHPYDPSYPGRLHSSSPESEFDHDPPDDTPIYASQGLPHPPHFFPPSTPNLLPTPSFDLPRPHFANQRDSALSWNTSSDSDHTRVGSEAAWKRMSSLPLDKEDSAGKLEHSGGLDYNPSGFNVKAAKNDPAELNPLHSSSTLRRTRQRRTIFSLIGVAFLILAILAVVAFSLHKSKSSRVDPADGTSLTASGKVAKLWGGNGDKITTENGTTFTYNNPLGGTWVAIPFNDTAKCQDDSPPLNQPWDYSSRRILGVNLGGWLVLEPFITPYLFEPFSGHDPTTEAPTVVDEWTLSVALGDKLASTLEDHYRTFITEEDFMQIAAAGLNWIRLPVGWWMIETWKGEPFLEGVSFKYFLKALTWARKYGLRVNLDLHAVPGSQNGFNHSGRLGSINFLVGLMGVANAQRTLNYIRTLTEFISQPQYASVVPMFSILNEAAMQKIGITQLRSFYLQVYQMMRKITGYGMGNGPMMVIHDGFQGSGSGHLAWGGFLQGADRLGLDTHNYFAFDTQSNDSLGYDSFKPCSYWAKGFNQTNTDFGFNFAGEYSLAINDCGLWLNNIGAGSRYDGTYPNATNPDLTRFPKIGSCDPWKDYRTWTADMKSHIADLVATSQDAMQNSFFWTWKVSRSILTPDLKPNPMWDYQLGLQQGWIRPDARKTVGACAIVSAQQGASTPVQAWSGKFQDWQIGAGGHDPRQIDPNQLSLYGQWPPNRITIKQGQDPVYPNVNDLPMYTPTGKVVVLRPERPNPDDLPSSDPKPDPGDGWFNDSDKFGWYVPIPGCPYPDPWAGGGLPPPPGPFCAQSSGTTSTTTR